MGTRGIHGSKKSASVRKQNTQDKILLERKIFMCKKNQCRRQKNNQIQVSSSPPLEEVPCPSPLGFVSAGCVTVLIGLLFILVFFL